MPEARIITADVLDGLRQLPERSVPQKRKKNVKVLPGQLELFA